MTNTVDAAVYRRAAGVLRTAGWTQGHYEDARGRHCLLGAVRVALEINPMVAQSSLDEPWVRPLADLLGVPADAADMHPTGYVVFWNDQDGRTAEDVLTLLEQAAEKLEAEI